jgi:hypothetical protein
LNSLSISKGECGELKSQVYRSTDDKYISLEEFDGFTTTLICWSEKYPHL